MSLAKNIGEVEVKEKWDPLDIIFKKPLEKFNIFPDFLKL
jgi:hypothetical protein